MRKSIPAGFYTLTITSLVLLIVIIIPVASSTTSDDAQVLTMKGFDLYKQDRFSEAISSFDNAIALDPYAERPWYGKGIASLANNNYDIALQALDQATTLSPKDEPAWVAKGDTFIAMGRKDLAITAYERVLQLNPQNAEVKNDLVALGISLTPTPFVTSPTARIPGPELTIPLIPVVIVVIILTAIAGAWYFRSLIGTVLNKKKENKP